MSIPSSEKYTIPLTHAEMNHLVEMVEREMRYRNQAAREFGKDRACIKRLIERVNETLGDECLSWGSGRKLVFPPEVRRFARALRQFDDLLAAASRFPRIAAGTMTTILTRKVLSSLTKPGRTELVRSQNVTAALVNGDIDLGVVQRSSLATIPSTLKEELLIGWQAVIIAPEQVATQALQTLSWSDPHSFAHRLTRRVASVVGNQLEPFGQNADSYLSALEMIRRELPYRVVIPDIYLAKADRGALRIIQPAQPVEDALVAVYRSEDTERLTPYLNPADWQRAVYD